MKSCPKCNSNKHVSCFSKNKSRKDGLAGYCKKCEQSASSLRKDKEWAAKRVAAGLDVKSVKKCNHCNCIKRTIDFQKVSERSDGLYSFCLNCSKQKSRIYNSGTESERRLVRKSKRNDNRANEVARGSYRRRKTDITRLRATVSKSIRKAIKSNESCSSIDHLPYTLEELKDNLESKFQSWMTWENWGHFSYDRKTWQIDHIVPQSKLPYGSFDDDNFKRCWSLDNLRPLEAIKNLIKGARC